MVFTKLALTLAIFSAGQTSPDVTYTNLRNGRIPRNINPQRLAEIRELQLFMSADRGRTWNQVDKITPEKEAFNYFTPEDGEYWYHVVLLTLQGKQEPADLFKAPPLMKLIVDSKLPELAITSAQRQGDDLVVSWSVREDNPDPPQLKLEYRPVDAAAWIPIPLTPSPQGTATARMGTAAPVVVRLQFKDLANNFASTEAEVGGSIGAAAYNTQPANLKGADYANSQPPPASLDKTPVPPSGPPMPPPPTPGTTVAVAAALPPTPVTTAGPATRQVAIASTLDNRQPTAVPAGAANAPRRMPELQLLNDPEVVLEYEVSRIGSSGIGKVEIWITRDSGTNWVLFAEDPDPSQVTNGGKNKRTLTLPGEGVYGISMLVKSKAGLGKPAPRHGDVPEMLLEVDTTPPEAQLLPLLPDMQHKDSLILSWVAKDRNLSGTPIMLEWAERPTGPWQVIGANLPNTGKHLWPLPQNLPSHVHLRLTVRDNAGNTAVAVTREPQLVDLSEPQGRLLGVHPANKK